MYFIEIYLQIIDIIYAKGESKSGIIVCKHPSKDMSTS